MCLPHYDSISSHGSTMLLVEDPLISLMLHVIHMFENYLVTVYHYLFPLVDDRLIFYCKLFEPCIDNSWLSYTLYHFICIYCFLAHAIIIDRCDFTCRQHGAYYSSKFDRVNHTWMSNNFLQPWKNTKELWTYKTNIKIFHPLQDNLSIESDPPYEGK